MNWPHMLILNMKVYFSVKSYSITITIFHKSYCHLFNIQSCCILQGNQSAIHVHND